MALRSRITLNLFLRQFSQQGSSGTQSSTPPSNTPSINVNVAGLSEAVVATPTGVVGPGVDPNKASEYKVPEYFCYNTMSYYEAEIEMAKHRLPQPSALK